jgi:tetratricopeptide (TPR) repeat protein
MSFLRSGLPEQPKRLNGWKAIGAYFGRDRTTVVRWARERQLPVRRAPGGKLASVYAFTDELAAWLENRPLQVEAPTAASRSMWHLQWWTVMASAAALLSAVAVFGYFALPAADISRISGTSEILPRDGATAAIYLEAKQNWAKRQSRSINDAIRGFSTVIGRDPSYAPAYAGLADSYILSREFGALPDQVAFPKAKSAAELSVSLAPNYAGGYRALGFVQYWWDHDVVAAGRSFRTALKLSPGDAQTHHWYGTSLTDNGDFRAARRELELARAINPESLAVQSDWAFALYATGGRNTAVDILNGISTQRPDFAASFDCLRYIFLGESDFPHYFAAMSALARLRNEPALTARIAHERATFEAGDNGAFRKLMIANATGDRQSGLGDKVWPLSIVSAVGDRATLIAMLTAGDSRGELWGSASQRAAISRRWKDDAQLTALLARRSPPSMER